MRRVEENLNRQSPHLSRALVDYQSRVDINCVASDVPAEQVLASLREGSTVFPDGIRGKFRDGQVSRYVASTITNHEQNPQGLALFLTPGIFTSAPGAAPAIANLYRRISNAGWSVNVAAASNSSYSDEMRSEHVSSNLVERAGFQAHLMIEILRQSPSRSAWMFSHSHGSLESIYSVPFLQELLRQEGMDTEVKGMLIFHSSGLFRQHGLPLRWRQIRQPLKDEAARQLDPQGAKFNMKATIEQVDDILYGADLRREQPSLIIKTKVILASLFGEILDVVPDEVRALINVPVGMVWGENDANFPASKVQKWLREEAWKREKELRERGSSLEEAQKLAKLFPNAPSVVTENLSNFPHLAVATDPKTFADTAIKMMKVLS